MMYSASVMQLYTPIKPVNSYYAPVDETLTFYEPIVGAVVEMAKISITVRNSFIAVEAEAPEIRIRNTRACEASRK